MPQISFSLYALLQLEERELSPDTVLELVRNPAQVVPGKRGRLIAQSLVSAEGGKEQLLRAVYEVRDEGIIIVTAYYTSKIRKYWSQE
jgi:hypothetical protein